VRELSVLIYNKLHLFQMCIISLVI